MLESKEIIKYQYPSKGFTAYKQSSGQQFVSNSAQWNLVQWSNQSTTIGTWTPGMVASFQTSLSPTEQFYQFANMGIPYITVHVGTAISTANQAFPSGTYSDLVFQGGFDLYNVDNPRNSYFSLQVKNTGTINYALYCYIRWQYVQSNSGALKTPSA